MILGHSVATYSEGVMTNQLLPLLELGASDRLNKANNDRTIATKDQGFSRTFEDAEKEITSNKPDAQAAKEAHPERQEPTAKNNGPVKDKEAVSTELDPKNDTATKDESEAISVAESPNENSNPTQAQAQSSNKPVEFEEASLEGSSVGELNVVGALNTATNTDVVSVLERLSGQLQDLQTTEGTEIAPEALQQLVDELFVDSSQLPIADIATITTEALNNQPFTVASAAQFINDLKKYGQLAPTTESTGVRLNTALSSSNPDSGPLNINDLLAKPSTLSSGLIGERLETLTLQANTNISAAAITTDKLLVADKLNFAQLLNTGGVVGDSAISKSSTDISSIAALSATQATTAATSAKPQLAIGTPFQQAGWGEAVTERVMWLSSQGLQEAEIHLNPAELGPMQVKVSVANEQAHVSFVVNNASVREALDQNAIRLREMFDGEGINLADVDVSDQSQQQAGNSDKESGHQGFAREGAEPSIEGETAISSHSNGSSLLSLYA